MEASNTIMEQFGRLQRWAGSAFQPASGLSQVSRPSQPRAGGGDERRAPAVAMRRRAAPFAAVIPGDTVVEQVVVTGLYNFVNLYNTALIVRLVLTWFPNPPEVIVTPLATVCDPYLNLFRGIIPPLGGTLDLSPILAFLVLNVFQSTAAALPCELPAEAPARAGLARDAPEERLRRRQAAPAPPLASMGGAFAPFSKYQAAWGRRVAAQRQKRLAAAAGASA